MKRVRLFCRPSFCLLSERTQGRIMVGRMIRLQSRVGWTRPGLFSREARPRWWCSDRNDLAEPMQVNGAKLGRR